MAQENILALGRAFAAMLLIAFAAIPAGAAPKGPAWASLTADQQQVLVPLAGEWNRLPSEQRVRWVGIAKRYPSMKPEEQKRVQNRMQKWAKLTPEQRWQARERYRSIGKLAPDLRREELRRHWAEYQALPPHERRMFDVTPVEARPAKRAKRSATRKPQQVPYSTPSMP